MEKLPPEMFEYYLNHVKYHYQDRIGLRHSIKRMGGKSLGIRLIIEVPFDTMSKGGQRYIIGPGTPEEQIRVLNWGLMMQVGRGVEPPKFKLREWKVTGGPLSAQIIISLDREQ